MNQRTKKLSLNAWLNIDKPEGVSSTFVVNKLKKILNPKKIGHAGTLDPAASGILPIALGEATKTIEYIQDAKKTYQFTIKFGETTDTLDKEGKIIEQNDKFPKLEDIEKILPNFVGKIKQTPPAYSAIKINGRRSYDLARAGMQVEMKEREVEIYSLKVKEKRLKSEDERLSPLTYNLSPRLSEITLECECSKGTYIRTLGADIAKAAQTIGYITFLRRTKVGNFDTENCLRLENTNEGLLLKENQIKSHFKPIDAVLDDIPVLHLDDKACSKLHNGLRLPTDSNIIGIIRVYDDKNKLIALAEIENGFVIPRKVFNL